MTTAPFIPAAARAGVPSVAAASPTPAGGVEVTFHTGLLVFVLAMVTVVLGLYISYQAYRGYRRNQSRPMLFLSVGIVLLTFVPAVFSTLAANLAVIASVSVLLSFLSRLLGLLSILYGIKYA